jgi:hypothetical protein
VGFGDAWVTGSTDIADGNWHHVACRFIGGEGAALPSHLHLFINGRPESFSHFSAGEVSAGRAGSLSIGGAGSDGLDGWIDEVHVFLEAIPTSAIQRLSEE